MRTPRVAFTKEGLQAGLDVLAKHITKLEEKKDQDAKAYLEGSGLDELRVGGESDYTQFARNGVPRMHGDATVWNDLRFAATTLNKRGVNDPDFVQFKDDGAGSTGVYAYAFDDTAEEELFFAAQLSHAWKEGSDLHVHCHWSPATTNSGNVVWAMEYTWANIDDTFGDTSTVSAVIASGGVVGKQQIGELGILSDRDKRMSSMLVCRFYRDSTSASDTLVGDVNLLEVDFHMELDATGSNREYEK